MRTLLRFMDSKDRGENFREVADYDLTRVHAFGPRLLESWRRSETAYWREQAKTYVVGSVIPLLGLVLFGWPVTLILVCTTADLWFIWLGDWVKIALARDAVQRAVDLSNDGDRVYATVHALRHAVTRHINIVKGRLDGGVRVLRVLDRDRRLNMWMVEGLVSLVPLTVSVGMLVYVEWVGPLHEQAVTMLARRSLFVAIAVCAATHVIGNVWTAMHSRAVDREQPDLLPNSLAPAYALMLGAALFWLIVFSSTFVFMSATGGRIPLSLPEPILPAFFMLL
jgi:hypothetical protein